MTTIVIPERFRVRRRSVANWVALNEVLLDSEFGLERETGRLKMGDGTTPWNDLPYVSPGRFDLTGLADGNAMVWNETAEMFLPAPVMGNPMTTPGDLVVGGTAGAPTRLAVGAEGQSLQIIGGVPAYGPKGAARMQAITTTGSFTLDAATHRDKLLLQANTGTITFPETAAAGFEVDDILAIRRQGNDPVTFDTAGSATLDFNATLYSAEINAAKDIIGVHVTAANTWALFGPLADA